MAKAPPVCIFVLVLALVVSVSSFISFRFFLLLSWCTILYVQYNSCHS